MGARETNAAIKAASYNPRIQEQTSIMGDMFMPNHSGRHDNLKIGSAQSTGQITFTTETTNNADVFADKGAFIHGTYDNTVDSNKSVSLIYINAENHNSSATSQLYPILMDLDTDKVDSGAGISINNNGMSDCIYLNVKGKTAGNSDPTGIGIDLNRLDADNGCQGLQIWDFSDTDRGVTGGPSGIYLRKHGATDTQHRLFRCYGDKNLVRLEIANPSSSNIVFEVINEGSGVGYFNIKSNGDVDAKADLTVRGNLKVDTVREFTSSNGVQFQHFVNAPSYKVGGVAGASGTFTTVDLKTVTVTNGIITSIV